MRYSEIKTMDELESAQNDVRERLVRREFLLRESLSDVKEAFTSSNLLLSGLRGLFGFPSSGKIASCGHKNNQT